ncbi:hypothetical protein D1007_56154 [Hordeum vulgare]|nr:hypothetical protein D1007_56154 [Hordeum vulgare]
MPHQPRRPRRPPPPPAARAVPRHPAPPRAAQLLHAPPSSSPRRPTPPHAAPSCSCYTPRRPAAVTPPSAGPRTGPCHPPPPPLPSVAPVSTTALCLPCRYCLALPLVVCQEAAPWELILKRSSTDVLTAFTQNSRLAVEEDNDGEEDDQGDDEEPFVRRRVVAKPPARSSSTHEDESLIGTDVLLYAWTRPETPVAKATIISVDPHTIVGKEPLGPGTYEVVVNVPIRRDATVPFECDGLQCIADAVTKSIPWPSSKERQEDKEGTMKLAV